MKNNFFGFHWDTLGFFASLLCAVHCAITPFVLAFSALGGLAFFADPKLEASILGISAFVAVLSLMPSYRRHHQALPLLMAVMGFCSIAIGHLGASWMEWVEPLFASCGGLLVAVAHWRNWHVLRVLKEQAC